MSLTRTDIVRKLEEVRRTLSTTKATSGRALAGYKMNVETWEGLLAKHDASSLASRLRYHDLDANGNLIARESVTPVASNPARSAPKPAAPSAAPTPAAVIKRRRTVVEEEHFPPVNDEDEDEDEDEEQDDEDEEKDDLAAARASAIYGETALRAGLSASDAAKYGANAGRRVASLTRAVRLGGLERQAELAARHLAASAGKLAVAELTSTDAILGAREGASDPTAMTGEVGADGEFRVRYGR